MYRPHPHQTPYWNQRDLAPRYPGKVGREQWPYSAYADTYVGTFQTYPLQRTAYPLAPPPSHGGGGGGGYGHVHHHHGQPHYVPLPRRPEPTGWGWGGWDGGSSSQHHERLAVAAKVERLGRAITALKVGRGFTSTSPGGESNNANANMQSMYGKVLSGPPDRIAAFLAHEQQNAGSAAVNFCANCGVPVTHQGANFCVSCGSRLSVQSNDYSADLLRPTTPANQDQHGHRRVLPIPAPAAAPACPFAAAAAAAEQSRVAPGAITPAALEAGRGMYSSATVHADAASLQPERPGPTVGANNYASVAAAAGSNNNAGSTPASLHAGLPSPASRGQGAEKQQQVDAAVAESVSLIVSSAVAAAAPALSNDAAILLPPSTGPNQENRNVVGLSETVEAYGGGPGGAAAAAPAVDARGGGGDLGLGIVGGVEESDAGEQFMAVKPFLGKMKPFHITGFDGCEPPSTVVEAPAVELSLAHVHGYGKGNVGYSSAGEIVLAAAGVGVVHSKGGGIKATFLGHGDDISCVDVDQDGQHAVSGEMGRHSAVWVWKIEDGVSVVKLSGVHKKGISAVAFGRGDGSRVVSVGADDDHYLCIWDWKNGTGKVAGDKCDKNQVLAVGCNPYDGECEGMGTIVTVGVKHIKFWSMSEGGLKGQKGRLGELAEAQTITCVAFVKSLSKDSENWDRGYAITGFQSGGVCIWKGSSAFQVVKSAHKGPVTCLAVSYPETEGGAGNGWVISGGRDGRAKVWDAASFGGGKGGPVKEILVADALKGTPCLSGQFAGGKASLKSVAVCKENGGGKGIVMSVGTIQHEVLEIIVDPKEEEEGRGVTARLVTCGHSGKEVWGLATVARGEPGGGGDAFATFGDDGALRLWGVSQGGNDGAQLGQKQHQALTCHVVLSGTDQKPTGGKCVAFCRGGGGKRGRGEEGGGGVESSSSRVEIACGLETGEVALLRSENGGSDVEEAQRLRDRKSEVTDLKYSPCGNMLAVGSKDKVISLYRRIAVDGGEHKWPLECPLHNKWKLLGTCKGHSSGVAHVDWSECCLWIQSSDVGYDLLFWKIPPPQDSGTYINDVALGKKPIEIKPHPKTVDLSTVKWATMTCPISWPTYGVFTGGADGSDVNAVDRAPDRSFLLSSDDSGLVNLISYPAVEGKTPAKKSFSGHSSHVTNVKVCDGGRYAVSTGGADLSVLVWEIKKSQ